MNEHKEMTNGNFNQLKNELECSLKSMRYSESSIAQKMRIFGWIEQYLQGQGEASYTPEWGQRFIAEYMLSVHPASMYKASRTLVRRLDEIINNEQFAPRFIEPVTECPHRFVDVLEKHLTALEQQGLGKTTIHSRKLRVRRFLSCVPTSIESIEKITANELYALFLEHEWSSTVLDATRSFFNWLHKNGSTKLNLSICVPKPRRLRALPSVYSAEEVFKLLSSVDRNTSLGKRDYAILMIASHTGLRSSDIVNMSLSDINYTAKTIDIVQIKTSSPITVIMNGEVEEAITDYIQHGRPETTIDKIFLNHRAPYTPLHAGNGHEIARKHLDLAGIESLGRKRGTHALRASFATALVAKGVPYVVVQEALGHDDPESAKYYARIDVRRLRSCALDVPKPTGAFAVSLCDLEV